jgi:hypothetical protein
MTAPDIRQFVGSIPDKGQSQTVFDTNMDAWLDWTTLQFAPDLVAFGEFASDTAAALVAANLPPLTGRAANMLRVNAAADGVEFRTPAQVLDDIGAAALAGAAFTGPVSSTAGDVNLKTVTALSDAAATLTAAQLLTGLFTIAPTVARTLTTATGTQIATALAGSVAGSNVAFTIVNLGAFDVTLAAGVGVTIVGGAVINSGSGTWRIRVDSSSAVTIYTEAAIAMSAILTQQYLSSQQTITSAGTLTLAHGLSSTPILFNFSLICKTAEGGYSIDDVVQIAVPAQVSATATRGASVVADATNINVSYCSTSNVFEIIRKDTGANFSTTNGSWRFLIGAWA